MIELIRLDERLIHGQIATKWSKYTGVSRIVVADDEAAESEIIKKSLLMAVPGDMKASIKKVEDAITLLNDPRCETLHILVLVKNPKNMIQVLEAVEGISRVNIGNYGRAAGAEKVERKSYGQNLYVTEEEEKLFKHIVELSEHAFYQTMPEDPAIELKKLFA